MSAVFKDMSMTLDTCKSRLFAEDDEIVESGVHDLQFPNIGAFFEHITVHPKHGLAADFISGSAPFLFGSVNSHPQFYYLKVEGKYTELFRQHLHAHTSGVYQFTCTLADALGCDVSAFCMQEEDGEILELTRMSAVEILSSSVAYAVALRHPVGGINQLVSRESIPEANIIRNRGRLEFGEFHVFHFGEPI